MEKISAECSQKTADLLECWVEFPEKQVVSPTNSNLYHYAGNNPVKYTDPDGESGKLTIYSSGNSLFDGHSWISYTPDDTGETTTYGTWGNNPIGEGNGLFENLEQGYGAQATRSVQLDDKQESALMETISQYKEKGENAWNLLGPCSKFAQDAWESATGEYLNANTLIIVNNPETLKKSIIKANGNVSNGTLDIPNSSSGASSVDSNSVDRSSGSSSYGVGSTSNVSSDPIYDSLTQ